MQATTIKLDPKLHSALRRMKPREQTLTAFVRELVAREEKRRALEAAAEAYHRLLATHADEAAWLASWEGAPLAEAPRAKRRRP
jgi:predicted transcriptional regulator